MIGFQVEDCRGILSKKVVDHRVFLPSKLHPDLQGAIYRILFIQLILRIVALYRLLLLAESLHIRIFNPTYLFFDCTVALGADKLFLLILLFT